MLNSARRDSSLESTLPPFIPALRIDGQSLPQGKRITSASEGQELHLHTDQVIKDHCRSLSPIPDLTIISGERITQHTRYHKSRQRGSCFVRILRFSARPETPLRHTGHLDPNARSDLRLAARAGSPGRGLQ